MHATHRNIYADIQAYSYSKNNFAFHSIIENLV